MSSGKNWREGSLIIGTLQDFREQMDWLFENYFRKSLNPGVEKSCFPCLTEMKEEEGTYFITAHLPGASKDDISINLRNNLLTIEIKMNKEDSISSGDIECPAFSRQYVLSDEIDEEKIQAALKDGVLTLMIPKKKGSETKVIQIKVA
ncbi:MAG: Hsp20/alpha crystallin family protein, partial [Candidatus Aureabacteria bacterium]|nr:Hsp20/alpha crystallin family protein [Candidatus Auribacterota bacterium]